MRAASPPRAAFASRLGLSGAPREAETIALDRDLRLAALTRARYHAVFVSNALSLEAMTRAKQAGLAASCGVSINHLTLNENDVGEYRTFLKLNPPLRGESERLALVEGLASGVIDVIVSDHEGQDVETKRLPFAEAAPGAVGLETWLSAAPAAGRRRPGLAAETAAPRCRRARPRFLGSTPGGCGSARRPISYASIPTSPMCSTPPTCTRAAATRRSTRRGWKASSS